MSRVGVAHWKEERGPHSLPSFAFFVVESLGGGRRKSGSKARSVATRILLWDVVMQEWLSSLWMLSRASLDVAVYRKLPLHCPCVSSVGRIWWAVDFSVLWMSTSSVASGSCYWIIWAILGPSSLVVV